MSTSWEEEEWHWGNDTNRKKWIYDTIICEPDTTRESHYMNRSDEIYEATMLRTPNLVSCKRDFADEDIPTLRIKKE